MRVIHVLRKPMAKSVAENVLVHGCGAIHVDAGRIVHVTVSGGQARNPHTRDPIRTGDGSADNSLFPRRAGEALAPTDAGGRWPANLILQHLPGCQMTGTTRVRSTRDVRPEGSAGRVDRSQWGFCPNEATRRGYADADGAEAIEVWECEPGCPVADLDRQGESVGTHPAGSAKLPGSPVRPGDGFLGKIGRGDFGCGRVGDAGGVSRFFRRIGGRR